MTTGRTRHFTDEQITRALWSAGGVMAAAARLLEATYERSCTRQQISHRISRSKRLTQTLREILDQNLDLAEGKLISAIGNGEGWAIQFMLKTQGKKRGWSEKLEIDGTILHEVVDNTPIESMTMQELDEYMAARAAGPIRH